jgi:hypothetical protein
MSKKLKSNSFQGRVSEIKKQIQKQKNKSTNSISRKINNQ